jgi:hypothetical protein
VVAVWPEEEEPAVGDQVELEADVVLEVAVDDVLEVVAPVEVDEVRFAADVVEVVPAAFNAQFVPRPTNALMLSAAATIRDRAAACRRLRRRCEPAAGETGRGRGLAPAPGVGRGSIASSPSWWGRFRLGGH